MTSKVGICNNALAKLGASRITSLTDNTTEAKLCDTILDDLIDEVLSEGFWSTAVTRVALASTGNTPEYEFTYEFQLPTDMISFVQIDTDVAGQAPFRIEGDKLLINQSTVEIKYIKRLTDTTAFGVPLTRAITERLAAELAYPLTGDRGLAQSMYEKYEFVLSKSLSLDAMQGSPEIIESTALTTDVRL